MSGACERVAELEQPVSEARLVGESDAVEDAATLEHRAARLAERACVLRTRAVPADRLLEPTEPVLVF